MAAQSAAGSSATAARRACVIPPRSGSRSSCAIRDGRVIWTGTYEETQPPLSDDLGSLPRAWERGFRWVTAEELADYGAARAGRRPGARGRDVELIPSIDLRGGRVVRLEQGDYARETDL